MGVNRPPRRVPSTSPLDVLLETWARAPSNTFPDELGRDLLAALADLTARLQALEARFDEHVEGDDGR